MRFRDRLVADWYAPRLTPLTAALWPLSIPFGAASALRRALYRSGVATSVRVGVPVVVVGNIVAGGTGKTPLALALADGLAVRGLHPGIVSRGYGGRHAQRGDPPRVVARDDDPAEVGDEPLLYASRGFPVAIGADRPGAARRLLEAVPNVDVLISDDGLQHYRLARDVEIAVVDGARGLGNRCLLPAGPLREPARRLAEVAIVVVTETPDGRADVPRDAIGEVPVYVQRLEPEASLHRVDDPGTIAAVPSFADERVHAVAGIGYPERFFGTLEKLGMRIERHAFPDHHAFSPDDLALPGDGPIVMTAKDAVKCRAFAGARCWYLPARAQIDPELTDRVERMIRGPEAP